MTYPPGTWIQYRDELPPEVLSADLFLRVVSVPSPDAGWQYEVELERFQFSSRLFTGNLLLERFGAPVCYGHLSKFVQELADLGVEVVVDALEEHFKESK